jgi:SAM-dependent methyltransferase
VRKSLQVERSEYEKLDIAEDRMWWFAAMHKNLLLFARRVPLATANLPILDAGCGTGGFLARLAQEYRGKAIFGVELEYDACIRAAAKSAQPVCAGSVNQIPLRDGSLAAIFSADVLCHSAVDEYRALRQFHRCLAENGWLVLNLPAYRWMLSRHDAAVHNARRYTASGLSRLLQASGFRPLYLTYWNAMLFPLMAIARKLFAGNCQAQSDVKPYSPSIDLLCRWTTGVESALLRRGIRLPFGGSVLAVAAKKGSSDD